MSLFLLTDSNLTVCTTYRRTNTLDSCIKSFPALYFLPVFLAVSQSRAASLSPPPYVVILISCSGLVSFVLLLLTCLCCKRGGVGFNVSLQHVRDSFTSLLSFHTFLFMPAWFLHKFDLINCIEMEARVNNSNLIK